MNKLETKGDWNITKGKLKQNVWLCELMKSVFSSCAGSISGNQTTVRQ